MVRWSQPVAKELLLGLLAVILNSMGLPLFIFFIDGAELLAYAFIALVIVGVVAAFLGKWRFGNLYDHEMSWWSMEVDQVHKRLAAAMGARGVMVAVESDGDRVIYPLPPLSIAVAPGWRGTMVFVGPSFEDNELLVFRLKAFVERALG
jgi:hypothetical protein